MRKLLILLVLVMGCSACEDVIDLELNEAAPRLVIDARLELLEDGSSRNSVRLTRSAGFFEEENPLVIDATVFITDGNGVIHNFDYVEEFQLYLNNTIAIAANLDYIVTIIDNGQTYTATQQLVTTVPLEGIEQEEVTGIGEFTKITAYFTDPETVGNNYLFTYRDGTTLEVDTSDDEFINGNRTPTSFFIEDLEPETSIQLTITGIDARAFQFFETLIQQTESGGGGPFDTQPATVRGNIINTTDASQFPFGYFRVSQVFELDYVSQ